MLSNNNSHIANINSFGYRSYYYDKETKLYYLNSRYYNPMWGRCINIDATLGANQDINSYNLYSYVSNNPINMVDPSGEIGIILGCVIIGGVAGLLAGGMVGATKSKAKHGTVKKTEVATEAIKGGVAGAMIGLGVGAIGNSISTAVSPKPQFDVNKGYNTFSQLKRNMPKPAPGNELHHIVEQSQISKSGFDSRMINNPDNIIEISQGLHRRISGYYSSSSYDFTNGLRVRDWLSGQSFESQYEFGIQVIELFKK